MNRLALFVVLAVLPCSLSAQYKYDNVLYKTIYWQDLCRELEQNPDHLLLDVRSAGEFADTSKWEGLNLGHIKGAKNITIDELGGRLGELNEYKDKPLYVYCSHSQRSRRCSKMLADSGFRKVYNINGGVAALHLAGEDAACARSMLEQKTAYTLLTPAQYCQKTVNNSKAYIIDVRGDAQWEHKDTVAMWNAYGNFRNAIHIPLEKLETSIATIPAGKELYLVDVNGDDAVDAANVFRKKGVRNDIYVLIDGAWRMQYTYDRDLPAIKNVYTPYAAYNIIGSKAFAERMQHREDIVLVDVRPAIEFQNKAGQAWQNAGHIKGAINLPADELDTRWSELNDDMSRSIIIYGRGISPEPYKAAELLKAKGFKNVTVLCAGLFDIRWSAANMQGMAALKDLVTDVPEDKL